MKIVFEYEDGPNSIVKGLKLNTINERTELHETLDELLSDPEVKNMYIIADDNQLE